jgi:predicted amidophosphoribosyltransferase
MNKKIMRNAGFGEQVDRMEKGICTTCGEEVGEFRNSCSQREYNISGMCQKCQDRIFGKD